VPPHDPFTFPTALVVRLAWLYLAWGLSEEAKRILFKIPIREFRRRDVVSLVKAVTALAPRRAKWED
jgi:hypothetical protein